MRREIKVGESKIVLEASPERGRAEIALFDGNWASVELDPAQLRELGKIIVELLPRIR